LRKPRWARWFIIDKGSVCGERIWWCGGSMRFSCRTWKSGGKIRGAEVNVSWGWTCLPLYTSGGVEILIASCNSQFPRFMPALPRHFTSAVSRGLIISETYDNSRVRADFLHGVDLTPHGIGRCSAGPPPHRSEKRLHVFPTQGFTKNGD
jgi:hypothetical protein